MFKGKGASKVEGSNQVWWRTPVILALGRLRQEDHEFKTNLSYMVRNSA
jgi:hypothetical protein